MLTYCVLRHGMNFVKYVNEVSSIRAKSSVCQNVGRFIVIIITAATLLQRLDPSCIHQLVPFIVSFRIWPVTA